MPILNGTNPAFISVDGAGRPNSGGSIEIYEADGLFTTFATIYSDQIKTTALANPITLSDAGTTEFWYEVKIDIREKTKTGVVIRDTMDLDPNSGAASAQGFNLAQNGSFEIDELNDGQPDNWTITPYSGSAIANTTSIVTNGLKALEFNAGSAGSGGGTATSAKFPVTEGSTVSVAFSFYATNATTTNTFSIKWYDEADALLSTSVVTMPASGSVPTSWTNYQETITVNAAGTQGEIVLVGIASGGANLISKAYFDGLSLFNNSGIATLDGVQTLTNKTLASPVLTTPSLSTSVSGTAFLDEDDMLSDSATKFCSQQSIKAYTDAVETKIASLNTVVIDINEWDMTGGSSKTVAHGLTLSKIRSVVVTVRQDNTQLYCFPIPHQNASSPEYFIVNNTNVVMHAATIGFFNNVIFDDDTAFNRGWITIQYID